MKKWGSLVQQTKEFSRFLPAFADFLKELCGDGFMQRIVSHVLLADFPPISPSASYKRRADTSFAQNRHLVASIFPAAKKKKKTLEPLRPAS